MSPLTILEFDDALVSSPDGNPLEQRRGQGAARGAGEGDPRFTRSDGARAKDSVATLERLNEVPAAERTFDNPEWVKFLLYNNEGEVRKALRSVFLDKHTAQIVTRLPATRRSRTKAPRPTW